MSAPRPVTDAELAEWESAARAGESATQIAKRFKRWRARVSRHLNAMGVPRLVNTHLPRDHVVFGPALADAARKLKIANPRMTRAQIATKLGVTSESLKWYLRKAGVGLRNIGIPKGNGPGNKGMARLDHSAGVQARPPMRAKQQPRAGGDVSCYLPHHVAGTSLVGDEAEAVARFLSTKTVTRLEQGEWPDAGRPELIGNAAVRRMVMRNQAKAQAR